MLIPEQAAAASGATTSGGIAGGQAAKPLTRDEVGEKSKVGDALLEGQRSR